MIGSVSRGCCRSAMENGSLPTSSHSLRRHDSQCRSTIRFWRCSVWRLTTGRVLDATCIAVTGSTGKTTAKDMIGTALSGSARTFATEGNFNTEIGLPLTILGSPDTVEILILEMGMRGLGQIELLCSIARPDMGVITNVNDTHIELLGSRERIALAKSELVDAIPPDGGIVLNGDDPLVASMAGRCRGRVLTVGLGEHCDLVACNLKSRGVDGIQFSVRGREQVDQVRVALPGMHNVYNALLALGVCHLVGYPAELAAERFETFTGSAMRMSIRTTAPGITVMTILTTLHLRQCKPL